MELDKDRIKKELQEMAPLLSKMKKKNEFDIPSDYFDRMQANVMDQIHVTSRAEEIVTDQARWKKILPSSFWSIQSGLVAACLIGILVLFVWNQNKSDINQDLFTELSEEELLDYIADHGEEFDGLSQSNPELFTGLLEELYTEEDIILENLINELNTFEIEELL